MQLVSNVIDSPDGEHTWLAGRQADHQQAKVICFSQGVHVGVKGGRRTRMYVKENM